MIKRVPPKTSKEILLRDFYMQFLRMDKKIPLSIVEKFKYDEKNIIKENKIYNSPSDSKL